MLETAPPRLQPPKVPSAYTKSLRPATTATYYDVGMVIATSHRDEFDSNGGGLFMFEETQDFDLSAQHEISQMSEVLCRHVRFEDVDLIETVSIVDKGLDLRINRQAFMHTVDFYQYMAASIPQACSFLILDTGCQRSVGGSQLS